MKENQYEPEFPVKDPDGSIWPGMSIRDWFAGLAMNAIIANGNYNLNISKTAYEIADAMLKERDKNK